MGFPIISMFRRVQREKPGHFSRQMGLLLLAGLIGTTIAIWVTMHHRDSNGPQIPAAKRLPSTPMPSGYLDRG